MPKTLKVREEKSDHTNRNISPKISNDQKPFDKSNIVSHESYNSSNMNHHSESSNTKNDFSIPKKINEDSAQIKSNSDIPENKGPKPITKRITGSSHPRPGPFQAGNKEKPVFDSRINEDDVGQLHNNESEEKKTKGAHFGANLEGDATHNFENEAKSPNK